MANLRTFISLALVFITIIACTVSYTPENPGTGGSGGSNGGAAGNLPSGADEYGTVVDVIDGDTIDVNIDGQVRRVRYVGVNTPERDEACYGDATNANRALVDGRQVALFRDESNTDRYERLLRNVYTSDGFVNERLVRDGYAEVVLYPPDDGNFERFRQLEQEAARANLNCHATGIFNDGRYDR